MAIATIANGASLSHAVDLAVIDSDHQFVAIIMPSAFTGTQLTFQASIDNSTYNNVYDDLGNEVFVTVAASRYIPLSMDSTGIGPMIRKIRFIKVRSGTSASPTSQAAARTITLVTK